jgi:hypothetical protein
MKKLLIIIIAALVSGCADDPGMVITIEGSEDLSLDILDSLDVTLVAMQHDPRTAEGGLDTTLIFSCMPTMEIFEEDRLQLPIKVTIHPGETVNWACVALRVQGYNGEDEVLRVEEIFCEDLYEGVSRPTLRLDNRCVSSCGDGEICSTNEEGLSVCSPSYLGPLFEVDPAVDQECAEIVD